MNKIYLFLATLFLLQGCINSLPPTTIALKQTSADNFTFESDGCFSVLPAKFLARQSSSGKLFTQRYILDMSGNIVVLEKISLDRNFMFSVGLNNIVYAGFEFKNYKTFNIGNFHTYFEATDRYGEDIYLLASGVGGFQDLSIIYSSSKDIIQTLATCVDTSQGASFDDIEKSSIKTTSREAVKSDWTDGMLFRHSIITSNKDNYYTP